MGEPPSSCLIQLTLRELPVGCSDPSTLGGLGFPKGTHKKDRGYLKTSLKDAENHRGYFVRKVSHFYQSTMNIWRKDEKKKSEVGNEILLLLVVLLGHLSYVCQVTLVRK